MEDRPGTATAPEQPTQWEPNRRILTCILFPGIVRNHERAIQCMGGMREISTVYSEPAKKRLGLTFSPENPYAKKTFGDCSETSAVLLRVRWRRRRVPGGPAGCRELVSTQIVGEINRIYKFESMLDFALLPAPLLSAPGAARCLHDQLVPSGCDPFSWLQGPAPCFIVPAHFTRSDKPYDYRYSDKILHPSFTTAWDEAAAQDQDHHHRLRGQRISDVTHLPFSLAEALPTAPSAAAHRALSARLAVTPTLAAELELVRKMFVERPIWSKNALRYYGKLRSSSLKLILPTIALYFKSGPWRQLWVRFGYDPRTQHGALLYQTLDFRMKNSSMKSAQLAPRVRNMHKKLARPSERRNPFAEPDTSAAVPEAAVVFRAGLAPYQRQIFYQLCDLKVPEVEETLARLCAEGAGGGTCHARRGWLPLCLYERVRVTLDTYARGAARGAASHRAGDVGEGAAGEEGGAEESGGEGSAGSAAGGGRDDSDADEYVLPDMRDD